MLSILGRCTRGSLTDMADCILITVILCRESLRMGEDKEKEGGLKKMEAITRAILRTMSQMDMENISTLVAISMKDNGKITSLMEKDKPSIRMGLDIMANF
jgi:hypothetical protein